MIRFTLAILALSFVAQAQPARDREIGTPASKMPPGLRNIGIDQNLDGQIPLYLEFHDETGQEVTLSKYFGRKPVILALVYYQCPMLCTEILNGLVVSLRGMSLKSGDDFDVVAVSIDPTEKPELAARKKREYLRRYRKSSEGWHFLTGSEPQIKGLAGAVGFHYSRDPRTGQFAHASAIMVLTPEGRLSRYFYGIEYASRDLRLGLVEASSNRIGTPVDQFLLFCYHYDPSTARYSTAILNVIRLGGGMTLLCLAIALFFFFRRERQRSRRVAFLEGH